MVEIMLFRNNQDVPGPETIGVWAKYKAIVCKVGDYTDGISPEDLYKLGIWHCPNSPLGKLSAHEFFIGIAALLEAGFLRIEVRNS